MTRRLFRLLQDKEASRSLSRSTQGIDNLLCLRINATELIDRQSLICRHVHLLLPDRAIIATAPVGLNPRREPYIISSKDNLRSIASISFVSTLSWDDRTEPLRDNEQRDDGEYSQVAHHKGEDHERIRPNCNKARVAE